MRSAAPPEPGSVASFFRFQCMHTVRAVGQVSARGSATSRAPRSTFLSVGLNLLYLGMSIAASSLPMRPQARPAGKRPLQSVLQTQDNFFKRSMKADPASDAQQPNNEPREVFGHWVEVAPSALPDAFLVAWSPAFAAELGLDPAVKDEPAFAKFFAGDVSEARASGLDVRPWATPYAVSVFGQPIPSPDPFGGGNAYGDGRALSLGEFLTPFGGGNGAASDTGSGGGGNHGGSGESLDFGPASAAEGTSGESSGRWELQLKGSGTTPFSRGGDGRAVLRSSIREFLVSEAMHAMGVPTTRALCLVASGSQYTRRMWYKEDDTSRDHPPDTMVAERCAITCRAAPSFLRVGHLELWSRRASRGVEGSAAELLGLVEHALAREFAHIDAALPLADRLFEMVRTFARRQARLSAQWLRVGYVQGNMNSDNCLLSGRTMDYGPFGFMERYDPLWSPFTSDMERKFGFERQPLASQVNLMTLARALVPLFERMDDPETKLGELQAIVQEYYPKVLSQQMGHMRRCKLGLGTWSESDNEQLWQPLSSLLASSGVDFTMFYRQLSHVSLAECSHVVEVGAAAAAAGAGADAAEVVAATEPMLAKLRPSFFEPLDEGSARHGEWHRWLAQYAQRVASEGRDEAARVGEMRLSSPKYIPREWMLAEAYTKAEKGDFSAVHELAEIFAAPFDEHSADVEARYYTRPPAKLEKKAGIAYFS